MKKHEKIEYIILSLILILSVRLKLYGLNAPIADWHSWRQADTASVSREFVNDGIHLLYPTYHDISAIQTGVDNPLGYRYVEFPFYNAITAWLYTQVGNFTLEVWARLIAILSSVGSTCIVYLLGRKFFGRAGGVVASFFFAFLPFNIFFSRTILPEPMAVLFGLSAVWLFTKFIDLDTLKWLYFSAFLLALSILVKPFTVFYGLVIFYLGWQKFGMEMTKNRKLWLYAFISLAPFLFWRLWMLQFPEGIPHTKWAFNSDNIRFKPSFWRWLFGERLGILMLGVWGIVPFIFSLLSNYKAKGFALSFLSGSFLFIAFLATANVRHDYYQIVTIPSIVFALTAGTLALWNTQEFPTLIARGILVFSVGMMVGMGIYRVLEFYKINRPEIVEAGKAVDALVPQDALVIAPYYKDTAFLYQTGRSGWPYVKDLTELETFITKGADYFVSVDFDTLTREVMDKYKMLEWNDKYVIVNLNEKVSPY